MTLSASRRSCGPFLSWVEAGRSEWRPDAEEHPTLARYLFDRALALQRQGRLEQATPLLRRTLTVHRKVFGDDHVLTAEVRSALGRLLASQQSAVARQEARALLTRAMQVLDAKLGPANLLYRQTRDALRSLDSVTSQPSDVLSEPGRGPP